MTMRAQTGPVAVVITSIAGMGPTVLELGIPIQAGLDVYAHCLRGTPGGMALLPINTSRTDANALDLPTASEAFTLSAATLEDQQVQLNGRTLSLQANDELPTLPGRPVAAGRVTLSPTSITFLRLVDASNASCR